jgi:hypothetical protein
MGKDLLGIPRDERLNALVVISRHEGIIAEIPELLSN